MSAGRALVVVVALMVALMGALWGAPLSAAAAPAQAAAPGSSTGVGRFEVVFLGAADGPHVYIVVEDARAPKGVARSARAAVVGKTGARTIEIKDVVPATRLTALTGLVEPPRGAAIDWTAEHGVVLTLHDIGPWQDLAPPAPATTTVSRRGPPPPRPARAPVADEQALRIALDAAPTTGVASSMRATLSGSRGAWMGSALARAGAPLAPQVVLVDDAGGLEVVAADAPNLFVVDQLAACGKAVPVALTAGAGATALRIVATHAPACIPGGAAVVGVTATRLDPKAPVALRGVLVLP